MAAYVGRKAIARIFSSEFFSKQDVLQTGIRKMVKWSHIHPQPLPEPFLPSPAPRNPEDGSFPSTAHALLCPTEALDPTSLITLQHAFTCTWIECASIIIYTELLKYQICLNSGNKFVLFINKEKKTHFFYFFNKCVNEFCFDMHF